MQVCASTKYEAAPPLPAYLSHSKAVQILCDMECTLDIFFTVFKTNCCSLVLIMPGRGDVCVYEGPKNKMDGKIKCLLQKVDTLDKSDKKWALLWWTPLW